MAAMSTTMDTNDTFGARIRKERLALGLSQEAFAKKLGVHRKTQGNYESGAREPDATYLAAAHKAGVDVGFVLTGESSNLRHRSLVHLVDVIIDTLELTKEERAFGDIWKQAFDELLPAFTGQVTNPKADRALDEFIRKSPQVIDSRDMADVIERLEFVADTKSLHLTPTAKAAAIIKLYRMRRSSGQPPDLQTVTSVAESLV